MVKSDDPWSIANLDEDFVRGARVRELSAAERAREAHAFKKADRKARRRLGGRRALGLLVPLAVVGGIVALSTRQRPTEGLSTKTSPTTVLSSPANAPPVATTTVFGTTTVALDRRTYAIGECVRWEQESTTSRRNVQTVSCEATHLYEMVGMTVVPEAWTAGSFPPDPEIHRMIDAACRGLAERYLESPLDPLGFLELRAVYPLKQGWLTGDRQMGCALVRRPIDRSDVAEVSKDLEVENVGSVRTSDQRFPWKIGDCLTYEKWTFRVPCEELHTYEFVGWGEFPTGSAQPFATDSTYGKSCDALAKTYQPEPTALIVLWDQVASESWAAGVRSFPCFFNSAARGPDGWPAKQVGSVRVVTV